LGLIAANVLTLGPLFSPTARNMLSSGSSRSGKAPSRAGSTRPITRASSRASSFRRGATSRTSNRSDTDRDVDFKRNSLIIEGPRRDSFDSNSSKRNNFIDGPDDDMDEYDLGDRRYYHHRRDESVEELDLEAWPRGIIKTVSVEVFEEVNEDYYHPPGGGAAQGVGAGRAGSSSGQHHGAGYTQRGGDNGNKAAPLVRAASRAGENPNRVSGASGMEQDWETMLRNGPPGK